MVALHKHHPQLNIMNLEAVAGTSVLEARVLLSPRASEGILPAALDAQGLAWKVLKVG